MQRTDLTKLLELYAQRYGGYHMKVDTVDLWWGKLKGQDLAKIKVVIHELIGKEKEPFGWRRVFTLMAAKFPEDHEQFKLNQKWRDNPIDQDDQERQRELSIIMRGLIEEKEKREKEDMDPLDWTAEYARQFVEIMGPAASERVLVSLAGRTGKTEHEDRFMKLVREGLS